jgi:hypothetical protein
MLRGASFCPLIPGGDRIKPYSMIRLSNTLGFFLAALIVLTAQSAAIARTMPDASGQMVLCTGNGPVMFYLDEHGEPTAPPHLCADFALSLILDLGVTDVVFSAMGSWAHEGNARVVPQRAVLDLGTPNARAPPVLILV